MLWSFGKKLKIAVLSGKGGTGKTFVSVNLSAAADRSVYVDCDVEEPNGHLFFRPDPEGRRVVTVPLPQFDQSRCTGCRICVDFCAFNALAFVGAKPRLFPDLCHSCGGCLSLCPHGAVTEVPHVVGEVRKGRSGNVTVLSGFMKTGTVSGTPVIRELYHQMAKEVDDLLVLDCPPGSACLVMESIRDADVCVLVAEPTVFGAHNLAMVRALVEKFGKPFGVVLNKCDGKANPSEDLCVRDRLPVLARIPFDADLGSLNSDGGIAVRELPDYRDRFAAILEAVETVGMNR